MINPELPLPFSFSVFLLNGMKSNARSCIYEGEFVSLSRIELCVWHDRVLKQLGAVELRLGHFETAHTWLDEALSLLQKHASSLGTSKTVSYDVGDLAFYEGDYERAQKYYEDCLAWAERVASSVSIGYAKVRLGICTCGEVNCRMRIVSFAKRYSCS
jgi:tetratricopeptide (TPR) repeat protein